MSRFSAGLRMGIGRDLYSQAQGDLIRKTPVTPFRIVRSLAPALLLAGLSTLAIGTAAAADSTFATRSVTVRLSDFNLAEDAGQRVRDRRLRLAARVVCSHAPRMDVTSHAAYSRCYRDTLDWAVSRINQVRIASN